MSEQSDRWWPEGLDDWIGEQDDDLFQALDKGLRSFGWPEYNVPHPLPMEDSWPGLALALAQRVRDEVRFLLDGLEVESLGELKELVDVAREDRYEAGYVAGLAAYAYSSSEPWAESGVQYVGTTGTTLREAITKARETWNYTG